MMSSQKADETLKNNIIFVNQFSKLEDEKNQFM